METILQILQAPLGTVLAIAGIGIVFFAFFSLNKGNVRMRKTPKDGLIPAGIGVALIVGGLLVSRQQFAPTAEPTAVPVAIITEAPFIEPSVEPSATTAPIDEPTSTVAPTETAAPTLTATVAPTKTFADNCISSQTWTPDSTNESAVNATPDQSNCLNVSSLGIAASGGVLQIVKPNQSGPIASGISTEIRDQAEIKFEISVQNIYIATAGNSAYITFAIAPKDDVMTKSGSGRFKLEVREAGNNAFVYFVPADIGELNGVPLRTMHYKYGLSSKVRLKLDGLVMNIYIGEGERAVQTVSIPAGPKVLYIGYNVPAGANVRATVKDLTIDGSPK